MYVAVSRESRNAPGCRGVRRIKTVCFNLSVRHPKESREGTKTLREITKNEIPNDERKTKRGFQVRCINSLIPATFVTAVTPSSNSFSRVWHVWAASKPAAKVIVSKMQNADGNQTVQVTALKRRNKKGQTTPPSYRRSGIHSQPGATFFARRALRFLTAVYTAAS